MYAPSSPRVYTIYEPVIRMKGQAKTVVTQRPFSSKEVQSVSLEPNSLRALLPTETHGLQSVLHKIGGTGNFVFLFAQVGGSEMIPVVGIFLDYCRLRWMFSRVGKVTVLFNSQLTAKVQNVFGRQKSFMQHQACIVHIETFFFLILCPLSLCCGVQTVELSDCEKTQALALRVLLSLSKFNQHRIHEMDCYHGYSMIHQVLIKSKCLVGYHMLKVSHAVNYLLSVLTTSAYLCSKTPSMAP